MAQVTPIRRLRVVRPDDFLFLEFHFTNLGLEPGNKGEPQILVPFPQANSQLPTGGDPGRKPYISIQFQSQSAGEQVFPEVAEGMSAGPGESNPAIPVRGEFAGPSFVVFELPADFKSAPFTLEGLLKLCYKQADIPHGGGTKIEAPFHLLVQPSPKTGWKHAAAPVTHDGLTELWHTRLGVIRSHSDGEFVDELDSQGRTLRATGSLDWNIDQKFSLPLENDAREKIVKVSAVTAVPVNRLMLSALGAWLDVNGVWHDLYGTTPPIEEWQHRMTFGRDHYVRTAEPGFLYPFGHRASLITITQRKFQDSNGDRAAFLRQRKYIIVREISRKYALDDFPFTSLTILNPVTPNLVNPIESAVEDIRSDGTRFSFGEAAFYPRILLLPNKGIITDFLFHLSGLDRDWQTVEFHLPLLFVKADTAEKYPVTMAVHYNEDEPKEKRQHMVLGGQSVAYTRKTNDGDAALDTDGILVRAQAIAGEPPVRPKLEAAIVHVPAMNQLSGKNAPVEIDYFPDQSNANGVFARVWNPAASLKVPTERAGGLSAPELYISGLSNRLGPIGGDVKAIADGHFKPADIFNGFNPKILGGVPLIDILKPLDFSLPDSGNIGSPVLRLTRVVNATGVKTILDWQPAMQSSGSTEDLSIFRANRDDDTATMTLTTELTAPVSGGSPSYTIDGKLQNFTVQLIPKVMDLIHLPFRELHFHAETGKKTDVSASMDTVKFVGPLSFVNELASRIPRGGFKDPPSVDVTPAGVDVSYSLGLPNIDMGLFSLQNVSFAAGLSLPFLVDPATLRLAFCERHSPFLLTVSAIGGGGFFGLELNLKGVQLIEFALEFGGNLAFDIGVASGGVLIMAGVYYENNAGQVKLTGYVRVAGAVEVLGLICISVEFFLGLEYDEPGKKAWGVATLTVEIEVLFFSADVSLTVRREFPKGGDPHLADLIPNLDTWQQYCDAFADYGVTI